MLDLILNNLPIIATGLVSVIAFFFAAKWNKFKKAGKILFDAIQDDKVSPEEAKAIANAFKELFK